MYNKYHFTHSEDSKIFFVSDTHFKHDREFLWGKRGFKNVDEHDETLIKTWNERVRPQDVVFHLGDHILGAGRDAKTVFENIFNRLNGHIYTVWGNHNAGAKQVYQELVEARLGLEPGQGKNMEVYPITWNDKVTFLGNSALLKISYLLHDKQKRSQLVHISHFAHRIWIDMGHGVIALSGHSHGSDKHCNPESTDQKILDVGIENFGGPVSFDEIMQIMKHKEFKQLDHHDSSISKSTK